MKNPTDEDPGDALPGNMPGVTIAIRSAEEPATLAAAQSFVRDHLEAHSANHDTETIAHVISALPAPYLPPTGGLWVAWTEDEPLGCVAIQEIAPDTAEVKRMYVRPEARGRGVGRRLAEHALAFARLRGYRRVRLATLPTMLEAQRLYMSIGFQRIEPYRPIDLGDSWFYELTLAEHEEVAPSTIHSSLHGNRDTSS
jgi:putative acetyltransferase